MKISASVTGEKRLRRENQIDGNKKERSGRGRVRQEEAASQGSTLLPSPCSLPIGTLLWAGKTDLDCV